MQFISKAKNPTPNFTRLYLTSTREWSDRSKTKRASKQTITQAEDTAASITENTVYRTDFTTKLISMLRLCANSTFGMEIHGTLSRLRCASNVTLIQIHVTGTTSQILYLVFHLRGGVCISSNITHAFSSYLSRGSTGYGPRTPQSQHL